MALEYFCDNTMCEHFAEKPFEDREEYLEHIRAHQRKNAGQVEEVQEEAEFDDLDVEVEE